MFKNKIGPMCLSKEYGYFKCASTYIVNNVVCLTYPENTSHPGAVYIIINLNITLSIMQRTQLTYSLFIFLLICI